MRATLALKQLVCTAYAATYYTHCLLPYCDTNAPLSSIVVLSSTCSCSFTDSSGSSCLPFQLG